MTIRVTKLNGERVTVATAKASAGPIGTAHARRTMRAAPASSASGARWRPRREREAEQAQLQHRSEEQRSRVDLLRGREPGVAAEQSGRERHQRDREQEDEAAPQQGFVAAREKAERLVVGGPECADHREAEHETRSARG